MTSICHESDILEWTQLLLYTWRFKFNPSSKWSTFVMLPHVLFFPLKYLKNHYENRSSFNFFQAFTSHFLFQHLHKIHNFSYGLFDTYSQYISSLSFSLSEGQPTENYNYCSPSTQHWVSSVQLLPIGVCVKMSVKIIWSMS